MGKMKNVGVKPKSVKKRVAVIAALKKKKKKPSKASSSSSGLLGQLGFGVGSLLGGPAGGLTGLAAGKLISKITGFGDYTVDKNSISNGNSVPTFSNGGKGMRVMHREFLTDITGSVLFTNRSYSINPGLVNTFPWLSLIAADFEEYEMHGLVFEYRPTSGTAISTTSAALGVVVLATQYDALDPSFSTKQQMESYEYATSTVPFAGCIHPVECLSKLNVLGSQFIRTGDVPSNADVRLYDIGNFQIATAGMQSAYTIGELWVSYDISFRKPRLPVTGSLPSYVRYKSVTANATTAAPLGLTPTRMPDSTLPGVTIVSPTQIQISTPGDYFISVTGTSTGSTTREIFVNAIGSNIIDSSGKQSQPTVSTIGPSNFITFSNSYYRVLYAGTGSSNYVSFTASAGMTLTEVFVMVVLLNPSLTLVERARTQVRRCVPSLSDDFIQLHVDEVKD